MATVTLEQYQRTERELTLREARVGLRIHALVTALVWAVVIPINVLLAPEFPWSVFVVAGTGIGMVFHWFGYRRVGEDIRRHHAAIERRADERSARSM
jgi:hypothetical protein